VTKGKVGRKQVSAQTLEAGHAADHCGIRLQIYYHNWLQQAWNGPSPFTLLDQVLNQQVQMM